MEKLCVDVQELIAKKLHKMYMEDVLEELSKWSPIEKKLKKGNPGMLIHKDSFAYMDTIILIGEKDPIHFVMWHIYNDYPDGEEVLIEGYVERNVIKIERWWSSDIKGIQNKIEEKENVSSIYGFHVLKEILDMNTLHIDTTYDSKKKWNCAENVCDWFYNISDEDISNY